MLAPILAACGCYVPMISGRGLGHTGGTLDKFDAIPGYTTNPDNETFRKTVAEVGCAIIGQTDNLAPADRTLYAIRDVTGTVESIPLITASILSKKLAAGLDALVLDVKAGSGAFMKTPEDARALAESLVTVANGAGMKTGALITDMNEPLATAAGNALEVRNAVEFLIGAHQDARLREVVLELCAAVLVLAGKHTDPETALVAATEVLDNGLAAERFARMVRLLGGPADFIEKMDDHLAAAPIVQDVVSRETGTISQIDARAVGMAVVALGGGRRNASDGIDYSVGFDRLAGLGHRVDGKTPIARIHARDTTSAGEGTRRLLEAYTVGGKPPQNPLIAERIMPGGKGEPETENA
jgi:thymidine phosphorylase